jgi:hypothetical protein
MAIAYVTSGGTGTSFSSTVSSAVNVGTADDRIIVCFASLDTSTTTTVDSATYNGSAMTAFSAFQNIPGGAGTYWCRGFYLLNPTSGSNTLQVTMNDGNGKPDMVWGVWSGVGSVSNQANSDTDPFATSHSETVSSATGDLVVALGLMQAGVAITVSGATVERLDTTSGNYGAFVVEEAGASSVTLDWTSNFADYSPRIALNLVAAGGGPVEDDLTGSSLTVGSGTQAPGTSIGL